MPELDQRDLIAASKLPKISNSILRNAIQSIPHDVISKNDLFDSVERLSELENIDHTIEENAYSQADKIISESENLGIKILTYYDQHYPPLLKKIPDFPALLYYKGDGKNLYEKTKIAVVGSRKASSLGIQIAGIISSHLSDLNYCVVSGLASGIDAASHAAALERPGNTVAVMAHGLDMVYPKQNQDLAENILANNGTILSEYHIGIKPQKHQYVQRNRIQSGISHASVVVESSDTGGTMYQGPLTKKQKRALFVVSPELQRGKKERFNYTGAIKLVNEFDATAVDSKEELISQIELLQDDVEMIKGKSSLNQPTQLELF